MSEKSPMTNAQALVYSAATRNLHVAVDAYQHELMKTPDLTPFGLEFAAGLALELMTAFQRDLRPDLAGVPAPFLSDVYRNAAAASGRSADNAAESAEDVPAFLSGLGLPAIDDMIDDAKNGRR